MNYEYCKIFYYVGKHKNITKAAAELYSSQPAVSRAIQSLEQELGCRLFVRNKSGVEFTHEGKILFEYASLAYTQLLKAEDEVSRSVSTDGGTIYIGATITALYGYLFDILNDFREVHPKVKFKITTGSSDKTIEKLKNGIVDLSFVTTPFKNTNHFSTIKITEFNDILIAGKRYSELKDATLPLEGLSEYPLICLEEGMQLREFIDDMFAENNLPFTPEIEPDNANLIVEMVRHNFGLGFVPQSLAEEAIGRGEIFKVNLEKELPPRHICLITDPYHPLTNASRELVRMINSRIKKQ
ncbi:MAG: LysR family transcriptional regulator [Clostridia bacterium]|nr:LysR family transcriptional regulator [Clostridia bacterium]